LRPDRVNMKAEEILRRTRLLHPHADRCCCRPRARRRGRKPGSPVRRRWARAPARPCPRCRAAGRPHGWARADERTHG
jgi:hypothetical protein